MEMHVNRVLTATLLHTDFCAGMCRHAQLSLVTGKHTQRGACLGTAGCTLHSTVTVSAMTVDRLCAQLA